MRPLRRRWVPALISALAIGGLSAAATIAESEPGAGTSISKQRTKKIAKRQANRQITRRAPGLEVAGAQTAGTADSATNADRAASARPFAYAKFKGDATVDPDVPSRNIGSAQISNVGAGLYCVDLPFVPTSAVATAGGGDDTAMIGLGSQAAGACGAGVEVVVRNWDLGADALQNDSIYLVVND